MSQSERHLQYSLMLLLLIRLNNLISLLVFLELLIAKERLNHFQVNKSAIIWIVLANAGKFIQLI